MITLFFPNASFQFSFLFYLPYLEGQGLGSSHPKSQLLQCRSSRGVPLPLQAEAPGYPPAAHGHRSRVIIAAAPGASSPHVTVPLHWFRAWPWLQLLPLPLPYSSKQAKKKSRVPKVFVSQRFGKSSFFSLPFSFDQCCSGRVKKQQSI